MDNHDLLATILGWLTAATMLAWIAPARWQPLGILACGGGLLFSVSPSALALFGVGTALTYWIGGNGRGRADGRLTAATVVLIAAGYGWFLWQGGQDGTETLLPLGVAYATLRSIHYLLERYKGTLRPHGFGDYLCYQLFPATLAVGPIHRFDDFLRDLGRRRWDEARFSAGLERIVHGLFKVVVLGGYLVDVKLNALLAGTIAEGGLAGVYADVTVFWLRLYLLFSGYSDLAVGFGALMGFRICENFRWPFLAANIGEFWNRWHMSLSAWCRDYVYTPVAALSRNHLLAIATAMAVLGLWHALSLHYLLWGIYHAAGLAVWRRFHGRTAGLVAALPPPFGRAWRLFAGALTLHFVAFSFPVTGAVEAWLGAG